MFDDPNDNTKLVVGMNEVTIHFGSEAVLSNINWQVKRGERWLIQGSNGSGKSMLLSLINGDNPKAFGQSIVLFDREKGSGESIWELKQKIGYVSPEMHLHFLRRPDHIAEIVGSSASTLENPYIPSTSVMEVLASGFEDQVGALSNLSSLQKRITRQWLEFLNLDTQALSPFFTLPTGQQRLLLFARALIKNPPLLILDEPCQGLDDDQTTLFKEMVDHFCIKFNKTLLYVSHFDQDIPSCITSVLELENGKILRIRER
jgi:molybdate transport system ATP-binding protein